MAESCVQGRGVMVDLHARFGAERKLVGYDDLLSVMDQDGVTVEEGDMLCLHTGYAEAILNMGGNPDPNVLHRGYSVLNGRDDKLVKWLEDSGVAVLIADNYAVEQVQGPSMAARIVPRCPCIRPACSGSAFTSANSGI